MHIKSSKTNLFISWRSAFSILSMSCAITFQCSSGKQSLMDDDSVSRLYWWHNQLILTWKYTHTRHDNQLNWDPLWYRSKSYCVKSAVYNCGQYRPLLHIIMVGFHDISCFILFIVQNTKVKMHKTTNFFISLCRQPSY